MHCRMSDPTVIVSSVIALTSSRFLVQYSHILNIYIKIIVTSSVIMSFLLLCRLQFSAIGVVPNQVKGH